jgi:hypothetical protein
MTIRISSIAVLILLSVSFNSPVFGEEDFEDVSIHPNMQRVSYEIYDNGQIDVIYHLENTYWWPYRENLEAEMTKHGWVAVWFSDGLPLQMGTTETERPSFWKIWEIEDIESLWENPIISFQFTFDLDNPEIVNVKISRYNIQPPHRVVGIVIRPFGTLPEGLQMIAKTHVNIWRGHDPDHIEDWETWYQIEALTHEFVIQPFVLGIEIKNPPEAPPGIVYGYLDMLPNASAAVENFEFGVQKEWLSEFEIAEERIVLLKYHDGRWSELPTWTSGRVDENYIYYSAEIESFSMFAIVAKIPEAWYTQPLNLALLALAVAAALGALYWLKRKR